MEKFEISDRVYAVISETGLQTVGDLMLQMKLDPDSIWKLSGMGPKAMQELQTALDKLEAQLAPAVVEAQPEVVEEVEAVPVEEPVEPAQVVAEMEAEVEAVALTEAVTPVVAEPVEAPRA